MRIGYIFTGITYQENFLSPHHVGHNLNEYTIDFRDTYNNVNNNLIEPYIKQGHEVDTFFVTYNSSIEDKLQELYKPKKILFTEYKNTNNFNLKERGKKQINDRLQGIKLLESYAQEHNIIYDFIFVTRCDLYFYKDITQVGIDYEYFNVLFYHLNGTIFSGEDSWMGIPGSKIHYYKEKMKLLYDDIELDKEDGGGTILTTHYTGKYIIEGGETIKYLYGGVDCCQGINYPFFKFLRDVRKYVNINDLLNTSFPRVFHNNEEERTKYGIYISAIGPFRHMFNTFMKDF